jgi:hypothetical protein
MKLFRMMVVRMSLLLTCLLAGGAFCVSASAGRGVLLGGFVSVLAFWLSARAAEKTAGQASESGGSPEVAIPGTNKLMFASLGSQALRMVLYGAAVYKGYTLDPIGLSGCWGAVGGLFVVRVVVSVLAITGWDLKKVA